MTAIVGRHSRQVGRNVRDWRLALDLTQERLAYRLRTIGGWDNATQAVVSRLELGRHPVTVDSAVAIARVFHVSLNHLILPD